jgi:AraC family transcriptional regulator of adaptative response / DNA-3-methyladenine glycosylase II
MKLPAPGTWDRAEARKGKFNGKWIIGVMTTGIYCLPSCAARPPKPENVRIFATEAQAQAAGLRACKRCRPDLFSKGWRRGSPPRRTLSPTPPPWRRRPGSA